jgi:hypothetical protein
MDGKMRFLFKPQEMISRNRFFLTDWFQLLAGLFAVAALITTTVFSTFGHIGTSKLYFDSVAFVLILVFVMLLTLVLKYRRMHRISLERNAKAFHVCCHNAKVGYFELQRVMHRQIAQMQTNRNVDLTRISETTEKVVKMSLDTLCNSVSTIAAVPTWASVVLFDVKDRVWNFEYDSIKKMDIELFVPYQSSNTLPHLIRDRQTQKMKFLEQVDFCLMIRKKMDRLFIPNMVRFSNQFGTPDMPVMSDLELLKFTGSKIIVPIRCLRLSSMLSVSTRNTDAIGSPFYYDYLGFLSAYCHEADAMRDRDSYIYKDLASGVADCIFPLLERYRTYLTKSSKFFEYREAHLTARISESFAGPSYDSSVEEKKP